MNNLDQKEQKLKEYSSGCLYLFLRVIINDPQYFLKDDDDSTVNIGGRKPGSILYLDTFDGHKLELEYSWPGIYVFNIDIFINDSNKLSARVNTRITCGNTYGKCDLCKNMEEWNGGSKCPRCNGSIDDIDDESDVYCDSCYWTNNNFTCHGEININRNVIISDDCKIELISDSDDPFINSFDLCGELNKRRSSHPILNDFTGLLTNYMGDKLGSRYPPKLNKIILEYL